MSDLVNDDGNLRTLLETLDPKARDDLRIVLITTNPTATRPPHA